jgi:hypothetical protein
MEKDAGAGGNNGRGQGEIARISYEKARNERNFWHFASFFSNPCVDSIGLKRWRKARFWPSQDFFMSVYIRK